MDPFSFYCCTFGYLGYQCSIKTRSNTTITRHCCYPFSPHCIRHILHLLARHSTHLYLFLLLLLLFYYIFQLFVTNVPVEWPTKCSVHLMIHCLKKECVVVVLIYNHYRACNIICRYFFHILWATVNFLNNKIQIKAKWMFYFIAFRS